MLGSDVMVAFQSVMGMFSTYVTVLVGVSAAAIGLSWIIKVFSK